MEGLLGIITSVKSHWSEITTAIAYTVAIASIIVKITPTLKDDTILLKVIKFLGKYIALNTNAPAPEERPK